MRLLFPTKNMKIKSAIHLLGLTTIVAGTAHGAVWTEVGDAGDIFTTVAQTTEGTGPLETISGSTVGSQVDAFLITITDTANFYATTASEYRNGTGTASFDTLLAIFTTSGEPLYANDDGPGAAGFRSYLSDPSTFPGALNASATVGPTLVPGDYILTITSFAGDPVDALDTTLFVTPAGGSFNNLYGRNLAAAEGALWRSAEEGTYTIELGGATFAQVFAQVPEPAAALFGLVGLAATLRRRR